MSDERITRVSLTEEGRVLEHEGGSRKPVQGQTDWQRLAAMTDEEVRRAAEDDPDAKPLTARQLAAARRVPERVDVRAIRNKRKMSQAAFSNHFGIALDVLRDWEQGRRSPSRYARILLTVIDREPDAVERALSG